MYIFAFIIFLFLYLTNIQSMPQKTPDQNQMIDYPSGKVLHMNTVSKKEGLMLGICVIREKKSTA